MSTLTLASFLQYQAPSWGTRSFLPVLGRKSPETEPSGSSRSLSRRDWRHGSCSLGSLRTQHQSVKVLQNEDNAQLKSKHFTSGLWNHSGSQRGRGTLRRGWEWRCWSWSLMGHVPVLRYQTAANMKRVKILKQLHTDNSRLWWFECPPLDRSSMTTEFNYTFHLCHWGRTTTDDCSGTKVLEIIKLFVIVEQS